MGYTHYWNFKKVVKDIENSEAKFAAAVDLFKKGMEKLSDIQLANGIGEGEPTITPTRLCFNGSVDLGQDYETFDVGLHYNEHDSEFNFCKTAYRPYDAAVCLALLCLKEAYGDDFSYSTDGNGSEDGWQRAYQAFNK